jgi:RNA polymerase sigma factor (sigma-70 family)
MSKGMSTVRERPCRQRARSVALVRSTVDAEAFHDFYVANRPRVLGFLARRALDPDVARDLTAETFAVALQRRHQFRGHTDAEAEAWLFAIARTQLSIYWRRGTAERRALALLGPGDRPVGPAELERIEELAGLRQLRRDVRRAITALRPDQAYAVQQRVVYERAYPDLAAELGVSEDVVRSRVSRGLRELAARTRQVAERRAAA